MLVDAINISNSIYKIISNIKSQSLQLYQTLKSQHWP